MITKYIQGLPALTISDLKTLIGMFQTELQMRQEEREKIRQDYQDELDRLLAAMDGDGFYIVTPDYTANYTEYVIKDREGEE